MLDMYLPKSPPAGKLPCIIVIHGGGWRSGSKRTFARFAAAFAVKGLAAACVGYRLRPEVDIPQCVEDVKAATRAGVSGWVIGANGGTGVGSGVLAHAPIAVPTAASADTRKKSLRLILCIFLSLLHLA